MKYMGDVRSTVNALNAEDPALHLNKLAKFVNASPAEEREIYMDYITPQLERKGFKKVSTLSWDRGVGIPIVRPGSTTSNDSDFLDGLNKLDLIEHIYLNDLKDITNAELKLTMEVAYTIAHIGVSNSAWQRKFAEQIAASEYRNSLNRYSKLVVNPSGVPLIIPIHSQKHLLNTVGKGFGVWCLSEAFIKEDVSFTYDAEMSSFHSSQFMALDYTTEGFGNCNAEVKMEHNHKYNCHDVLLKNQEKSAFIENHIQGSLGKRAATEFFTFESEDHRLLLGRDVPESILYGNQMYDRSSMQGVSVKNIEEVLLDDASSNLYMSLAF